MAGVGRLARSEFAAGVQPLPGASPQGVGQGVQPQPFKKRRAHTADLKRGAASQISPQRNQGRPRPGDAVGAQPRPRPLKAVGLPA